MSLPEPGSIAELAEVAVALDEMHWIPLPFLSAETACGTQDRAVMGTDKPGRVTCPACKAWLEREAR